MSFRRSYIRFILILSIKGNLTSSHSNVESGPWTLWHRNERTTGGKVLEPALVIKHLWAREQGTVVTKCMNYSKPQHTRFVSASPQRCHRDFKTEKREVRSVIHPSGWTCWFIRVAAQFLPLPPTWPRLCHQKATISDKRSDKSKGTGNLSWKIPGFLPIIKIWCLPDGSSGE